jgi:transcriptional regulator with XRE-family HTH domain
MERLDDINPARIEWCLHDHGISLEKCAADNGISLSILEKVMAGEIGLTFSQLKKLGAYFGRTALFFLEKGAVEPEKIRSQSFRSLLNQKLKSLKQLNALFN